MIRSNPLVKRLAFQLVPAALVTTVGIVVLSSLTQTPDPEPAPAPMQAAINGDAIFTATPRPPALAEPAATAAGPRVQAKARSVAANPPRKPEPNPRQVATLPLPPPPPLQTVPANEPQPAQARVNPVIGTLRTATAAVTAIPHWAANSMANWFSAITPPRPPAPVPAQNFQASM